MELHLNFFFIAANLVGMSACYFIERYARLDFAQRRMLEIEKAKSESLLQKEAVATRNAGAAMHAAHSLKGSSGYVGASCLTALCAELERNSRGGSLAGAEELMAGIEREFARTCRALDEFGRTLTDSTASN